MFTVIPASDKRDCIEIGVVLEELKMPNKTYYVASTAISIGKGDSDLLITHNPVVEPSLEKVSGALTYQLTMLSLQSLVK